MVQKTFKRYELKYIINPQQKNRITDALKEHIILDKYGKTTIKNIYFDTPDYLLIRRSIEKPLYKEKLRLRCYENNESNGEIFVELKKKYNHIVYKRRITLDEVNAIEWICKTAQCPVNSQIAKEIDYFINYYGNLRPAVFLSYQREAYKTIDESDFRLTFDENILCRFSNLTLEAAATGLPVLPTNKIIMEIKCSGGMPLWITKMLSDEKIYKTSFSKYGTAYKNYIFPTLQEVKDNDR